MQSPNRTSLIESVNEVLAEFDHGYGKATFDVRWRDDALLIGIAKMYELGDLMSFACLSALSDVLGTRQIDTRDRTFFDGCETCDYGSSDEVTIVATWPEGSAPK